MTPEHRTVWNDLLALLKGQVAGGEFSLAMLGAVLRRRWIVLATCTALGLAAAVLVCVVVPPEYTAQSLLQITARQDRLGSAKEMVAAAYANGAAVRSEVDVLGSRKLAERVVKKLKLQDNADFQPQGGMVPQLLRSLQYFLLPLKGIETVHVESNDRARRIAMAADRLLENLRVEVRPRSYTIEVDYVAHDPRLAAAVANALVDAYLDNQLEERFAAARRASAWINGRMLELQRQVQASELAVKTFREAHGLTRARGVLLSEQQMAELSSQLILARTQLAEAEAKESAAASGVGSTSEVLNNPLIQNLRMQETEVRRRMNDLAVRYGSRHPRMQTVRNELRGVQHKIAEESAKIKSSLSNTVAMAQARVATLEQQLDHLQSEASLGNDAAVKLAELERQAKAERALYETFLARSKEIAQLDFAQADARLITRAAPPFESSGPDKASFLSAGLVLGALFGVMMALLLEGLDMTFRTVEEMENVLGVRALGLVGELAPEQARPGYVTRQPGSVFAESVRGIRTALQFSNPDKAIQVVMVTSTVPREGKSFFALSLAQLTAASGSKVLLVDTDFRRPALAGQFKLKPKAGLAEVLVKKAKLANVVVRHSKTLDILPVLPNTPFSQELLASQRMKDLVAEWRKTYDLIVIDCPPVMAVTDALSVSQIVDALLLMVRWGATPRPLARATAHRLKALHAPLAGSVLTRVDLQRQAHYLYGGHDYYDGKYRDYYPENA